MHDMYRQTTNDTSGIGSNYYDYRFENALSSQMIIMPQLNTSNNFDTYTIEKGDTLYNIAKKYSTNFKTLQYLNGLEADDYVYPGQKILIPKNDMEVYIVDENETLRDVAQKNGVSVDELIKYNSQIYLYPEQLLFFKKGKIS